MASKKLVNYYFPHLRRGQGAVVNLSAESDDLKRPQTTIHLKVQALDQEGERYEQPVEQQVAMYGPGDVLGFDANKIIVKLQPVRHEGSFLPTDIPFVEFAEPDFLWRYSAAKSGKNWIPWLSLIVLKVKDGEEAGEFELVTQTDPQLPRRISLTEAAILPDLNESWRWAHVHYNAIEGLSFQDLKTKMASQPRGAICRLLCARRLKGGTKYAAFVVPSYLLGLEAAMGRVHSSAKRSDLSWAPHDSKAGKEMPYYYSWEFRTGLRADFEQTLRLLQARPIVGMGGKTISIDNPGYGIFNQSDRVRTIEIDGALQSSDRNDNVPNPLPKVQIDALAELLNSADDGLGNLRVVPPVYGRWINRGEWGRVALQSNRRNRYWLEMLNLDLRYRIAAGLGAQYVKENQEALMEQAWKQLGKIQDTNQMLNLGRFGREISTCLHKRLQASSETILEITRSAEKVITLQADDTQSTRKHETLRSKLKQSAIPNTVASRKARKYFTRKKNMVFSQHQRETHPISNGRLRADSIVRAQLGPVGTKRREVPKLQAVQGRPDQRVVSTSRLSNQSLGNEEKALLAHYYGLGSARKTVKEIAKDLKVSSKEVKQQLDQAVGTLRSSYVAEVSEQIVSRLHPQRTIELRMRHRIDHLRRWEARKAPRTGVTPGAARPEDPLRPVMAYPEFHAPMYRYLLELSEEYLVPGLENIPRNTVAALISNRKFIEAFMVGLNHELAAELRWREYPTDLRGSYFRSFWDTTSYSVDAGERQAFRKSEIGKALRAETDVSWSVLESAVDRPEDFHLAASYEQAIEQWLLTREEDKDIAKFYDPEDDRWDDRTKLGEHPVAGGTSAANELVLLIRADVLKKFPNTLIYLARKTPTGAFKSLNKNNQPVYPIFEANLPPDILGLGFPMDEAAARQHFIVFEERKSEERFGLDVESSGNQLNDLSWEHFGGVEEGDYIDGILPEGNVAENNWGQAAYIPKALTQKPVRMAIDLNLLLP